MAELDGGVRAHRLAVTVIPDYADARLGACNRSAVGGVAAHADILRMRTIMIAPLPIVFIVVLALLDVIFGRGPVGAVEVVQPDLVCAVGDNAQLEETPDREAHLAADHLRRAVVHRLVSAVI